MVAPARPGHALRSSGAKQTSPTHSEASEKGGLPPTALGWGYARQRTRLPPIPPTRRRDPLRANPIQFSKCFDGIDRLPAGMIWTPSSHLPLIQGVAQAIVDDIIANGAPALDGRYTSIATDIFAGCPLAVSVALKPLNDLEAIEASAGSKSISLRIGSLQRPRTAPADVIGSVGGALCHELVHKNQSERDSASFIMAAIVQKEWHKHVSTRTSPEEWLTGYYGTVYEFEALAEQVAYEIWLHDTISGISARKNVSLAAVSGGEALRRIKLRLNPPGATSSVIAAWMQIFESKVNEALSSW
ncbi:hypothetical protein NBEOAGPD_0604 [Methylobacterium gregans]|uniref:Uncharacterized protein n=2 Tax=Methylobacterium gregans TaxID=374424 RepID=A0AA37M9G4_9HYPH|nr:hypothetical protein NBEOAGPD_0604 [Methylobacterium gregans]